MQIQRLQKTSSSTDSSGNTALVWLAVGFGLGLLYFWLEEATQEKEANCSYLASPLTDVLALSGAGLIAYRGFAHGDYVLMAVGASIAGIHTGQVAHFKGWLPVGTE